MALRLSGPRAGLWLLWVFYFVQASRARGRRRHSTFDPPAFYAKP
jgi:hypothetical protein